MFQTGVRIVGGVMELVRDIVCRKILWVGIGHKIFDLFRVWEILGIHRNHRNSQTSYELTEILGIHRNPSNSRKSYESTEII